MQVSNMSPKGYWSPKGYQERLWSDFASMFDRTSLESPIGAFRSGLAPTGSGKRLRMQASEGEEPRFPFKGSWEGGVRGGRGDPLLR